MSARQVDDLSMWEAAVMARGLAKFHGGGDEKRPPSPEEHDALVAKYA